MKRRTHLWFLALLAMLAAQTAAAPLELPFESNPKRGAILLRGKVNGKAATFLLDTGAAYTVLSVEALGVSHLDLQLSKFSDSGPGLHGEAVWASATLILGKKTWDDRTVVAMNLSSLAKVYGRRIDGIIGQDLLTEYSRVTIDFKRKSIRLEE